MSLRLKFILIVVLAVVTGLIAMPHEALVFDLFKSKTVKPLGVKEGLDLQGGAQLVFQADFSKTPARHSDDLPYTGYDPASGHRWHQ